VTGKSLSQCLPGMTREEMELMLAMAEQHDFYQTGACFTGFLKALAGNK
jgi:hypothetical protein